MGQRWQSLPTKCQKRRDVQNWSQSRQFRVTNLPDGRIGPQRKPTPTNPHARCGAVRGWPVLSAHFRPEQRTTDGEGPVLVCVLFSWAMKTILQKPLIRMVNFGRSILNTGEVDNCPNVIQPAAFGSACAKPSCCISFQIHLVWNIKIRHFGLEESAVCKGTHSGGFWKRCEAPVAC
jgi:hypothetical protein